MARTVIIEAMVLGRSDRALKISVTGDKDDERWLPSSQIKSCEILHPEEEIYKIEIPEWLATKEGLV